MAGLVELLPGLVFIGQAPGVAPVALGLDYIALLGLPMADLSALPNPITGAVLNTFGY